MTIISLDEVNTAPLCFVVFISVQLNRRSLKSKQNWKITLPDSIKKCQDIPILLSYKCHSSSFSEDRFRIAAL